MKNKVKIFLFASLMTALILPFSMMDNADAKSNEKSVTDLLKDVDKEVKQYVKQDEKDKSKDEKKVELKTKYDEALDKTLEKIERAVGHTLDDQQISKFKDYVMSEIIKRAEIEQAYLQDDVQVINETVEVDGVWNLIPEAQATTNQYPISRFVQPSVDVSGGTGIDNGWPYSVDGDNQLESVTKIVSSSQSMTRYVLEWHDEDHPVLEFDIFYDQYRLQHYGRIADVETFVVLNGLIQFDGIWDEDKTYSYLIASHGDKNRNWYNGVSIYANTWNHALDIYDHNLGLTKYVRYF